MSCPLQVSKVLEWFRLLASWLIRMIQEKIWKFWQLHHNTIFTFCKAMSYSSFAQTRYTGQKVQAFIVMLELMGAHLTSMDTHIDEKLLATRFVKLFCDRWMSQFGAVSFVLLTKNYCTSQPLPARLPREDASQQMSKSASNLEKEVYIASYTLKEKNK